MWPPRRSLRPSLPAVLSGSSRCEALPAAEIVAVSDVAGSSAQALPRRPRRRPGRALGALRRHTARQKRPAKRWHAVSSRPQGAG